MSLTLFERSEDYLHHILESIVFIEDFISGMDFDAYQEDVKTYSAVERKLLIISEAAIRMGEVATQLCPDIPWADIRGIGNTIRHRYDGLSMQIIWNITQTKLPPLKLAVAEAIKTHYPPASETQR